MKQKTLFHTHFYLAAALMALLYLILFPLQARAAEGFDLYTDTPGIRVTAGDSVSFNLHLTGGSAAGADVSLSAVSMPDGFTGYFKSGSYEVSRVHATGSAEDTIASFQVTVPKEASQGVHEIRLKAVSDSGLEDELVLELTVSELESGESNFYVEYQIGRASCRERV